MLQSIQGVLIALAIMLLLGIIVGFYLRQARINQLTEALKRSQQRQDDLERGHQQRLQEATQQLQQDYAAQLAEKMEVYQQKHEDQINRLEAEYQSRQTLTPPEAATEQVFSPGPTGYGNLGTLVGTPGEIEDQIRHQYETRLREVAAKLQQAYEQHLRVKLAEARDTYHQDYEKRLAEKIEHYQDQLTHRTQELEQEFENRLQFLQRSATEAQPLTPQESGQGLEDLINAAIDNVHTDQDLDILLGNTKADVEDPTDLPHQSPL